MSGLFFMDTLTWTWIAVLAYFYGYPDRCFHLQAGLNNAAFDGRHQDDLLFCIALAALLILLVADRAVGEPY